jgi:capsid protein
MALKAKPKSYDRTNLQGWRNRQHLWRDRAPGAAAGEGWDYPETHQRQLRTDRLQLHAIAAGLGITYEQLTGDLSQVNYSSLRAGLLEFRRLVEMMRWQVFVPKLCIPVWRKFIERAYVAGEIGKIDYGVSWTPQKFEMIDPMKDAQADTLMIRNGTLTLKEAIARQGFDPEQQIEEIAATNKLLDDKEIILDCDPRYTAKSGIQQSLNGGSNADTTPVKQSTKKSKQLELPIDGEGESSAANEDGDA